MLKILTILVSITLLLSFSVFAQDEPAPILEVMAVAETAPSPGDGVSTPLIWLHPADLSQSLIIGMDDNEGIGLYDLDGNLLAFDSSYGGLAISDLRYGFGGAGAALIAAGAADQPHIHYFTIEPDSRSLVYLGFTETGIRLEGVCLYHSPLTDRFYAIAFSEFGQVEQYVIREDDGDISATLARAVDVGGELEGCTVDDALRRLYFAEGENLVWRYGAEPEDGIQRRIVDFRGGAIDEEVESLAIYTAAGSAGYLIVTNETADTLLLYERAGDNAFVGEFKIVASETIDSVSEPAGISVTNLPLDERFPQGLFVTSDDVNSSPNADSNWKLVSWADVAAGLGLTVDTTYDPRLEQMIEADAASVTASVETVPVPAATDAADDPAIWVHPTDRAQSLIIGTDKVNGLVTYNLDGSVQQTINLGRLNNVDLRDGFMLNGQPTSIVVATNRTLGGIEIYAVDVESRMLVDVAAAPILSNVEEVYGICMYTSPVSGTLYAFVNSADTGEVEQHALIATDDGKITTEVVRTLTVGSQTEGCVVDDENSVGYIGEEAVGLWKFNAEPDGGDALTQIDSTGEGGHLTADVEGVTLYPTSDGGGYLIVSSQGSSTFVVYERLGDNAYIGTFRIVETETVDAVSGTDGLDVTPYALGEAFPDGVLVVQDDLNINPASTQNFKLISWRAVAEALGLEIDVR